MHSCKGFIINKNIPYCMWAGIDELFKHHDLLKSSPVVKHRSVWQSPSLFLSHKILSFLYWQTYSITLKNPYSLKVVIKIFPCSISSAISGLLYKIPQKRE